MKVQEHLKYLKNKEKSKILNLFDPPQQLF